MQTYDVGPADAALVVVWFHGTPNIGSPPEPLFATAERLGIRWIGYDRPGYGGSPARPGRDVASAAADVAGIADRLGVDRFAVMGHSGGGPHALACAALLPGRVRAALVIASLAPPGADGLDFYAGMAPSGQAALRAAARGRAAREQYQATAGETEPGFTPADWAALGGEWSWFASVVTPALAGGPGPQIDDDLAYMSPWGFDPARITAPTLLLHGEADLTVPSSHSAWLAGRIPGAQLRLVPGAGHLSVLHEAPAAMRWLHARAG